MAYVLIVRSAQNEDRAIYETLEEILDDFFLSERDKDIYEEFSKLKTDEERIELLEECLNNMDILFSPEDDSVCQFQIKKIS